MYSRTLPPSLSTSEPAADAEPPIVVVSKVFRGIRVGRIKLTSRNDVIHNQHLLARLHSVGLHLEEICAIFLHVLSSLAGTWELAPLADRHEGSAQP